MSRDSSDPCFVVGAERSGSTLLRLVLDGHSELSFPHEYDFVLQSVNERGERCDVAAYREWLRSNAVFRRSGFAIDESLDVDALNASFLAQRSRGRVRVGGTAHGRFSRLLQLWPNARFVFLVRDPRAQSLSIVRMGWAGHVWRGVEPWLEAQREWATLCEQTRSDRRHVVRYEDFATDPARTIQQLCAFLGVAFEPAMLRISERSTYSDPSNRALDEWRTQLSPREQGLVDARVFPAASRFGYAPTTHARGLPSSLERATLEIADRIGRIRFACQRYGLRLYLARVAANRLGPEGWRRQVRERLYEVDQHHIR